jgi:hypothetical protein
MAGFPAGTDWKTEMPSVPWDFDPSRISSGTWLLLGEALSKSNHIARIPLGPVHGDAADRAGVLRGAFATLRLDGVRSVPGDGPWAAGARLSSPAPSAMPVRTAAIVDALDTLAAGSLKLLPTLTPGAVVALQARVAGDRDGDVGSELPALCAWLNGPSFVPAEAAMAFPLAVMKACCAHLALRSLPWASGSTARLLEVGLLLQSGAFPVRSASAATEHYRDTPRQYRRLVNAALASRRPEEFVDYAVRGIVHGLRRQLDVELQPLWIRRQWDATWEAFARARLSVVEPSTASRCLDLLVGAGESVMPSGGTYLSPEDFATLAGLGLVRSDGDSWKANFDAIRVWPGPR